VTVQAAGRTIIDLGARASVLDAMDRLRDAPDGDDLVIVIAAGAPVARSPVFLEVVRRAAGRRRLAIVSSEVRTRALASSVHVAAFASTSALERQELDATEPLTAARRAALARPIRARRASISPLRFAGVFGSLLAAGLVFLAVVAPAATVVVAPVSRPLGPIEFDLRAGPAGAEMNAQTLTASVTAKVTGSATGSRSELAKARGSARFTNQDTQDVRVPKGTVVRTRNNVFFQTLEEKVIPRSQITVIPPFVTFGSVDIAIEAVEPGPQGNVAANTITTSDRSSYSVTNPQPTSGGDSKKIPVVTQTDYDLAVARSDDPLRAAGNDQVERWKKQVDSKQAVYGVSVRRTSVTAPGEIVGKELKEGQPTFELTVAGDATGYSVAASEPRATALTKLRAQADPEHDIDGDHAIIDVVVGPAVASDGVHWRVRGRASQFPRVNRAALSAALAGHGFGEIRDVVEQRRLSVVRVTIWPAWWPRLPVLDSRIDIQPEAPASAASP
jgi:hypothetical protein